MASTISLAWLSMRPSVLTRSLQPKRRGVDLKIKRRIGGLLLGLVIAAFQVVPAHADEEQLQRQIDAMKRQSGRDAAGTGAKQEAIGAETVGGATSRQRAVAGRHGAQWQ